MKHSHPHLRKHSRAQSVWVSVRTSKSASRYVRREAQRPQKELSAESEYRTVPEIEKMTAPVTCIHGSDEMRSGCRLPLIEASRIYRRLVSGFVGEQTLLESDSSSVQ
jgi:hypothetical protein